MGILDECNKIIDARHVASHARGTHIFTISSTGNSKNSTVLIFQSVGNEYKSISDEYRYNVLS